MTTAETPRVSDHTGSVTGYVMDEEQLPVPSADVALIGALTLNTQTDATGRFTFNDVEPGVYNALAQRLGFESGAKKVTVVAGNATEVQFVLRAIAVEEPRVEHSTYDGYIEGDIYTAAAGLYYQRSFHINLTKGATEIVSTMQWQATMPVFTRYMRIQIDFDGESVVRSGRSPVTANLTGFEIPADKERATVAYRPAFACAGLASNPTGYAMCISGNPDALVPQIAYQQRVRFYNSVFYYQNAPEGYTGLPE